MHTETMMAAALTKAGVNTTEARLRILAQDALKKHHGNVERAIKTFEKGIDGDTGLIREALRFYLAHSLPGADHINRADHIATVSTRHPNGDGGGHIERVNQKDGAASSPTPSRTTMGHAAYDAPGAAALFVREPSASQTAADLKARTQSALTIFDRTLTHSGRRWGNIVYRELDSLREDGDLAAALKEYIGHRRGNDRHKPIRELITPLQFHGILRKVGRVDHAA